MPTKPSVTARFRAVVDAIVAAGAEPEALSTLRVLIARVSTKRAKGRGQSSKSKGRNFMVRVANLITVALGLDEGDVFVKATSQIGQDLHLSPRAAKAFPFAIEGKCVEALNIWAALRQAEANATEAQPAIVFFSRAHSPTYVAIRAEVFLEQQQQLSRRHQKSPEANPESV